MIARDQFGEESTGGAVLVEAPGPDSELRDLRYLDRECVAEQEDGVERALLRRIEDLLGEVEEGLQLLALRIRVNVSPGAFDKTDAFAGGLEGFLCGDVDQSFVDISMVGFLDRELMDLVVGDVRQSALYCEGGLEALSLIQS